VYSFERYKKQKLLLAREDTGSVQNLPPYLGLLIFKFLLLRGTGTVFTIVVLLFIILLFYTVFYCFHGIMIVQQQWTHSSIAMAMAMATMMISFADIHSKASIKAQAQR
jgi:hypothetical protein